jgi:hypothetical protein
MKMLKMCAVLAMAIFYFSACQKEPQPSFSENSESNFSVNYRDQTAPMPVCSAEIEHEIARLQRLANDNCARQISYFHCTDVSEHPLCYLLFAEPTAGNCQQTAAWAD